MDPVRQRILGLVAQNRSNLRMASLAIGRNAAYLHQFIHRGTPRVLAEDDREALAKHLGCSPEEIKHGRPPNGEARPQPPSAGPRAVPMGYSAVPEIDVRAAAGPGAWNEEVEQTKATWLLADPLIRHEFRASPEDLRMITVDGDSMEPLFSSGDRILIDVSRQVPVPPGIFVIWDGMGLVTKRIRACAPLRTAQGGDQVRQPGVRQLRTPRRRDPHRRTRRLGLKATVSYRSRSYCRLEEPTLQSR